MQPTSLTSLQRQRTQEAG
ncbi:hypothetical protein HaLaN_20279, partial [Haematococcus lacustris]